LAQAAAIFFALIIVKLFPRILDVSIGWFVALAVVCAVKPLITFYGHGGEQQSVGDAGGNINR
jgi:hypothetical protein